MVTVYDLGFSGIFQYDCFQRAGAIQTGAGPPFLILFYFHMRLHLLSTHS